jgi:hypothetical protein
MLFVFISLFSSEIPTSYNRGDIILLSFLLVILLTSAFIWPGQLKTESFLRKNNNRKIRKMILSLGNED